MAESSLPPPPPTHGNGPLIGFGLVVLLLVGGGAFWLVNSGAPSPKSEVVASSVTTDEPRKVEPAAAPPPPPPPPPDESFAAQSAPASETMGTAEESQANPAALGRAANGKRTTLEPNAAPGDNSKANNDGCSGTCQNRVDAALSQAVRQRGVSAKNCYNAALRSNPNLQGKVSVKLRVGPSGSTCSTSIASDTLGDPSVTSCILQKFKGGGYPKPTSGCADFEVPLAFIPSSN